MISMLSSAILLALTLFTDQIWLLGINLDAGPSTRVGNEPIWLWGLGPQQLLDPAELQSFAS